MNDPIGKYDFKTDSVILWKSDSPVSNTIYILKTSMTIC